MYNEKILLQLNELKYLQMVKKSNVNVISKKNPYGDMIKFYAQINKKNIIQKISYKASGCTHFLVFGNYFCQLAEGKSLDEALKIDASALETLEKLNESKKHIVDIILNTFALLVKKYRNGVQSGKIIPAEVEDKKSQESKPKKGNKTGAKIQDLDKKASSAVTGEKVDSNSLGKIVSKSNKDDTRPDGKEEEKSKKLSKKQNKDNESENTISDISNISKMIQDMERSLKNNTRSEKKQNKNEKKLSSMLMSLESIRNGGSTDSKMQKEPTASEDSKNTTKSKKEIKEQKRLAKKQEKEAKRQQKLSKNK